MKNPDGSTTTRNANGQKVTRPGLRRNPTSSTRLATVACNNNAAKMQTLARCKTAEPISDATPVPPPAQEKTSPRSPTTPYQSTIYCSKACANTDANRSAEVYESIARTLSYEWLGGMSPKSQHGDLHIFTNLPHQDANPYGPPSPLFISDTESSNASNPSADGPACSAPKIMEYFRMSRDGPEEAWKDYQKQRRSSMQHPVRPESMTRQRSRMGEVSTDSLSSMWYEGDFYLGRSLSGGGKIRMTPVMPEQEVSGTSRRSISSSSDRSGPIYTGRSLVRSNLSQTSLAISPSPETDHIPLPAEFGSAPKHTLDLYHSYASAFPVRTPSGNSASSFQKGFIFPGSIPVSPTNSRRGSMNMPLSTPPLLRSANGTIRASARKIETHPPTWDAFGKGEIQAQQRKASASLPVPMEDRGRSVDITPKQSLEVANGRWQIRYYAPNGSRSKSRSSDLSMDEHHLNGIAIPPRTPLGSSAGTAHARTPQPCMPPPPVPDLSTLRLNAGPCSAPKSEFNWDKHEKKGGKVYDLPEGLKVDRSKAGLFYFE